MKREDILKDRIVVLKELINKYAQSANQHEHDFIYGVLKGLLNEIKEECNIPEQK